MAQAVATQPSSAPSHDADVAPFLRVAEPLPRHGLRRFGVDLTLAANVLRVGLPVVLGMVTQTAINILDGAMVGYLPKAEANPGQAAIGLALPFMWLVGGFLSAVWVGTQAITSRRAGERNDEQAGRALTNSLVISTGSSIALSTVAILLTPAIIRALYHDPRVISLAISYIQIRLVGVLAMVTTFSLKSFFDGLGKTHVFMTAAVVMNLMNVVLNYLLIFGHPALNLPEMGVAGAAWASVISAYVGLGILIVWSLNPRYLHRYHYYSAHKIDLHVMREIVRLSLPNGAATVVVMIGFSAFYWVVGQVNALHAAVGNPIIATANQVVIMAVMPSFMTSLAFGSATAAVVSQSLGAGRTNLAQRYGWESVKLWTYIMGVLGLVMLLWPDMVSSLFTHDPDVVALARTPLRMLACLHGIIAVAVVLGQTLYGLGKALFVMKVEMVLHLFVMAPGAALFGLVLGFGLDGVYMGPILYASILAIAMFLKYRHGDWKEIRI